MKHQRKQECTYELQSPTWSVPSSLPHMSNATESSPPREFKQRSKQPDNVTMTMGMPAVHSGRAENLNTGKEGTFVTILLALLPFLVWPLPLPPPTSFLETHVIIHSLL